MPGKIPVLSIMEAGGVAVEKRELGAVVVDVRVDIVLLSHARHSAVIEEPYESERVLQ